MEWFSNVLVGILIVESVILMVGILTHYYIRTRWPTWFERHIIAPYPEDFT